MCMGCSLLREHDDASGDGAWPRAGAAALVASHARDVAFTYSDLPGAAAERASRSAASNASADGTRTSGCTPVPSQLPPLNGLTGEPVGTNTASPSRVAPGRSEEHTSELQSLMRKSYAVFCLNKKKQTRLSTT